MLDPLVSLAFSVYSARGVYAALLGSGISRSSGIQTGWEITLDLAKKLAALSGTEAEDPADWYRKTYSQEPDYSVLLEELAKQTGDRHFTLRPYFEPTAKEIEEGTKVPTAAHKAIAELVAKGYVRVIVTTNFDHLMEQALAGAGVTPNVVSSADQAKGMTPLAHARCTIIKVHGDYTDIRIRNTLGELASYELEMDRLLDQVFDEYGLIVCGWSAEWDEALRAAVVRCPSRRFTTYWSAYSDVSDKAKAICVHRGAQIIRGMGADAFFGQLKEKVEALEAMDASRHPLSKQMAVASVKKYITEDRYRPQLHDLFMGETERVRGILSGSRYPKKLQTRSYFELGPLITAYDSDVDTLLAMMIAGGFWGNDASTWVRCLERITSVSELTNESGSLCDLALYPARLLLYGCGVAAIASNRNITAAILLTRCRTARFGPQMNLWHRIGDADVIMLFNATIKTCFASEARNGAPMSNHLFNRLLPEFHDYVSGDREFRFAFNRFEYLAALIYADYYVQKNPTSNKIWAPHGLFVQSGFSEVATALQEEIDQLGTDNMIVKAGAFGGSIDRLKKVKELFDNVIMTHRSAMVYEVD